MNKYQDREELQKGLQKFLTLNGRCKEVLFMNKHLGKSDKLQKDVCSCVVTKSEELADFILQREEQLEANFAKDLYEKMLDSEFIKKFSSSEDAIRNWLNRWYRADIKAPIRPMPNIPKRSYTVKCYFRTSPDGGGGGRRDCCTYETFQASSAAEAREKARAWIESYYGGYGAEIEVL